MFIRIRIDDREPPRGDVWLGQDLAVEFTGWLGLIKALSDAMGAEGNEAESGRGESDG